MEAIGRLLEKTLLHYEKKEYPSAEKLVDELLASDPNFHKAWFLKGVILEETGRRAEAEKYYEKAGNLFTMWIRLALQLHEVDPERAVKYYERVLELDPGFNMALLNKGLICEKTGRLEEARTCFRSLSPGKELFSKVVIPVGFIVFLIGSGVMLLQRGEKIISMFAFASTVFCFFWLRRDAGTAVKMLLKKNAYK
jgi:tetratricopeptide (TPR) repeat protein